MTRDVMNELNWARLRQYLGDTELLEELERAMGLISLKSTLST